MDPALIYPNDITTLGSFSLFFFHTFRSQSYSWGEGGIKVVAKRMRMPYFEVAQGSFRCIAGTSFECVLWMPISIKFTALARMPQGFSFSILLELASVEILPLPLIMCLQNRSSVYCVFNLLKSHLHLEHWSHSILVPQWLQLQAGYFFCFNFKLKSLALWYWGCWSVHTESYLQMHTQKVIINLYSNFRKPWNHVEFL